MKIIPAINCTEFEDVETRFKRCERVFKELGVEDPWVQLDISDGTFTRGHQSWLELEKLTTLKRSFKIEAHIMATFPETLAKKALEFGCERIILHVESSFDIAVIKELVEKHNAELCFAIEPRSKAEKLYPFLLKDITRRVMFLSVIPGLSGQPFKEHVYKEIEKLSEKFPDVTIEVDGGASIDVVKLCKRAGASEFAVGSYLFRPRDINVSYQELSEI